MPPKSASKRDQVLWFLCEKCKANVASKDREQHDELCPLDTEESSSKCVFVRNGIFHSNKLAVKPITDDVRGMDFGQLSGLVFLSESAMTLCGFVLGETVVVRTMNGEPSTPIVRNVWPLPNSSLTNVLVAKEDFENTWQRKEDAVLRIEKLTGHSLEAGHVFFDRTAESSTIGRKAWRDICPVLLLHLKDNLYCVKNIVHLKYFNKTLSFAIREIRRRDYSQVIDDLETKLQGLSLDHFGPFYRITKRTKLELILDEDHAYDSSAKSQLSKMNLIGGLDWVIKELRDATKVAFGETTTFAGYPVPRTALIYGNQGCGKSLLCEAFAEASEAIVIRFNASQVFSKSYGESVELLRSYFDEAYKNYPNQTIVIIEDIHYISHIDPKDQTAKLVHAGFQTVLDELHERKDAGRMFLMVTSNNIDKVNVAVRRYGRLDLEFEIPAPDPKAREEILIKHLNRLRHTLTSDDIKSIAENSHGFVGADLATLVVRAALHATVEHRTSAISSDEPTKNIEPELHLSDITAVYAKVTPSAMKELLVKCPNVQWSEIGGQEALKLQLQQSIEWPLKHPIKFLRMGINPPRGVLMFGPPGCSKTMIAKALATESRVNFLSVKGPELFSMWVGESERAVRELFRKARLVAPAIIFFDEIDALGGERSRATGSGSSVNERVLAQMLTEIDGINSLNNVTIVAATNRPDLIDKALMRPGRLDRIVYVKLPDAIARKEILEIKLSKMPLAEDFELEPIVAYTEGYSGAEIQAVCQEAALYALEECLEAKTVQWKHFERALASVKPRTSPAMLKVYEDYVEQHSTR